MELPGYPKWTSRTALPLHPRKQTPARIKMELDLFMNGTIAHHCMGQEVT